MPAPLAGLAAGIVKGGAMLGRGAMAVGRVGARGAGALARNTARTGAQNFITGKKKTVKPDAIKKRRGPEIGPEEEGALTVRPSSSLVQAPAGAIAPVRPSPAPIPETGKKVGATLLEQIRDKVIDIDKVLKGIVFAKKEADAEEKQDKEDKSRAKQEKDLEKVDKKDKSNKVKGLKVPGKGLFAGIFEFLKNILIGRLLVWFIQTQKGVPGGNILTGIANFAEGVIDTIIGVLDAIGGFLVFTNKKSEEAKDWLKRNRGDEAEERYEGLLGALTNLFNAFVIVGSAFAALGGLKGKDPKLNKPGKPGKPGAKPGVKPKTKPLGKGKPGMKPTGPRGAARAMQMKHGHAARGIYENAIENGKTPRQAKAAVDKALKKGQITSKPQTGSLGGTDKGSKIAKGGLKKVPKRLATKVLGKQGIMAMKGIAKGFSRIPILGPIVVAVSSLLAGEPPGQALFKGLGAALGGFLGTFIPIPVLGTMLGEVLGTFVGDLLYSLILGGGPKEAGDKLMNAIKTALDVGGLIVKFVGDGFKNFINGFFEKDPIEIPDGLGRRVAATKIVEFLGMKDFLKDRGYVDGKDQVTKFPNLMNLINPFSMIGLLGQSFFGGISGASDTSSATAKEEDDTGQSGERAWWDFAGVFSGGNKQPELTGNDEGGSSIPDGDGPSAAGTSTKGMITGPAGYSRIGAGAAYHVDTKFHSSLGMGGMISAMDKMADAYAARGKEIVFSGQGYARLKAYKSDLDPKEKKALLTSAIDAHSHSSFMRAEGFKPFDYYIPDTGIRDLYHPSTEKAEIILPDFGGKTNVGALYSGYGKSANIFDSSGKHVAMTGHGDLAYAEGGETLATPHMALIGEKGKEFVVDADSYEPIERMLPGLFDAINEAEGEDAIAALMAYTDYERPQQQQPAMAGIGGASGSSVSNEPSSNVAEGGGFRGGPGARARVKRNFSFRYKHG